MSKEAKTMNPLRWILHIAFWTCCLTIGSSAEGTVSYDHRALVIDGNRRFLISGSIHYPRSTPEMWPNLIQLAKEGGLDVIDTYVFWNGHEPRKGIWNFRDRFDLVAFVKTVQTAGLLVNLRIGPYIAGEWNFGGLPAWLREIPGIAFRTDNEPFKEEMQRFMKHIVQLMQQNNLFYSQGGPIIMAQVENEYGIVEPKYGEAGVKYLNWAADMALSLNTTVPWTMCKQPNAPGSIINTCNGFYCDRFTPNNYDKPMMWTENWTGWFRQWGYRVPNRPVEDIAYAVAHFFQHGGSFMNYYMYHGGTNFDRTAAQEVTTSYDYDAPIDEYGLPREPKYSHLKSLHEVIKLCIPALAAVDTEPLVRSFGELMDQPQVEIHVYADNINNGVFAEHTPLEDITADSTVCAAFIANNAMEESTVRFLGKDYLVPAWSVSILPDCNFVEFNTAQVDSQTILRRMIPASSSELQQRPSNGSEISKDGAFSYEWESILDPIGARGQPIVRHRLLEQINLTDDHTDYLWYSTNVLVPQSNLKQQSPGHESETIAGHSLSMGAVQDLVRVFVNGEPADKYAPLITNKTGVHQSLLLKPGSNSIDLLCVINGLKYAGPFFEKEIGGVIGSVVLRGPLFPGTLNMTNFEWKHQVGLKGERLHLQKEKGNVDALWLKINPPQAKPLVWYKTRVKAPAGDKPVALDMGSMSKGQAWINGHSIGRYWPDKVIPENGCSNSCDYRGMYRYNKKCLSDCGLPSQRWYHVPRAWLKAENNVLVLIEEIGGDPTKVGLLTFDRVKHTVCSDVFNRYPHVSTQTNPEQGDERDRHHSPLVKLDCGDSYKIAEIQFASYGEPSGKCGSFIPGRCHASRSAQVLTEACVGRQHCSVEASNAKMGEDPCPDKPKRLAVQALCYLSTVER